MERHLRALAKSAQRFPSLGTKAPEETLARSQMEVRAQRTFLRVIILIIRIAAAVLMMKRSKAIALNQPILAKFCGATVSGVAPRIMGIGPSLAIPKLLSKFNLNLDTDIDIIEINEAFASMAVYCTKVLNINPAKMNVRGGAIALGHPLGATGTRQICTGLSECRRQKKKVLLTSMCIGTGQGMAGLFVNEQL